MHPSCTAPKNLFDADADADDFFGGMAFASAPPESLLGYRDTGKRIEDSVREDSVYLGPVM